MTRPTEKRSSMYRSRFVLILALSMLSLGRWALGQEAAVEKPTAENSASGGAPPVSAAGKDARLVLQTPNTVDIEPAADDRQIAARLQKILEATGWFEAPQVRVEQGVVFLGGSTEQEEYRAWAGDLAKKTQAVVAVVNQIRVLERSMWDLSPAWREMKRLGRDAIQALPLAIFALAILLLTWLAVRWTTAVAQTVLGRRLHNPLLIGMLSRAIAVAVFLLGLILALRISGLTQMAATVLGGTGLFGLVLGIAFRDIAENYLASILISMQRPFAIGDMIEVEGRTGIVQSVTTRGTLLMTVDGNHVQIPNASVYKSVIRNLTANPNVRCTFVIGIGYANSLTDTQEVLLRVLKEHDGVLAQPDPQVLIENLGEKWIDLRVYFWVNSRAHSIDKVRSSVLRLAKAALDQAGIIFPGNPPAGIGAASPPTPSKPEGTKPASRSVPIATEAEGNLSSDQSALEEQARRARRPEQGQNLLTN